MNENMENSMVETASEMAAVPATNRLGAKLAIGTVVALGVGYVIYKGAKLIKNKVAAKKAAKAAGADIVIDSIEEADEVQ